MVSDPRGIGHWFLGTGSILQGLIEGKGEATTGARGNWYTKATAKSAPRRTMVSTPLVIQYRAIIYARRKADEVYSRQVQIMSTLPLKAISRVWGWFNELTIPYYLRVPGFKLYSFIFGVK